MPLNVPLVDTFGPFRQSIGQLTNALQDAPRMQMERLQLGEAQRHQQENQELQQLMARTPATQRPQVAIQFLESKGRTQDAAILKHERFQQFHDQYQIDPQSAITAFPEYGVDPSRASQISTTEIPGTKSVAVRQAGKTSFVQRDPTDAEVQSEATARAKGTMEGGRKTPEELLQDVTQAGAVAGAQEEARQKFKPVPTERPDVGDWAQAFQREKGRAPTSAEIDAHVVKMRPPTQASLNAGVDLNKPLPNAGDESMAQQLAAGKATPAQLSKRQGSYNNIIARAGIINPELNIAEIQAGYQAGLTNQKVIRSLDAVDKGLNTVLEKSKAFNRSEVGILNNIILKGEVQFNDKRAIQFQTAIQSVIDDLASALSGGGATTDQARNQARTIFNSSYSQGGLESAIGAVREVMNSRREAFAAGTTYEKKSLPSGGGFAVKAPDGKTYRFSTQEKMNEFKRQAGIQ